MKRKLFTSLMLILLSGFAFAQTLTLHFSGQVTNSASGAAVANHQVYIMSDSSSPAMPYYYAVATTNANGVYQANITLSSWVPIIFHVYTYDCNGLIQSTQVINSNISQLVVNFSICFGIQPPPPCNASFTVMPVSTNPMKYYFQNTSGVANNYSCQWTFGDGTSASGYNTYHIYSQAGTYTVCLTIINQAANCYDTVCQTVTVAGNPPPPCNVTFSAMPDSANSQLWHFVGTSTNPNTSLLWSFGDGTNGNGTVVQHFYQSPGTYVVCAKIPGSNGTILCSSCDTIVVSGNPPLPCNASFTISPVSTNPNKFYFHSTSTGASQFACYWSFGDGSSGSGNNTYHVYSQSGTYTVCLTIINQGANCYDTVCQTVTVGTIPPPCNAGFTFNTGVNCVNCIHFVANMINSGLQYQWYFGDGTPAAFTADPVHAYAQAGTYQVCLVVNSASGCTDTVCQYVTVGGTPPPCNAEFTSIQDSVNDHFYHFFANYPNAGPFTWSFGDGSMASGPVAHHVYLNAGYYVVCLQVINPNGQISCSQCDTIQVTGNPVPTYHLWGHVFAGANTLLDKGKVRLFKLSNATIGAQLIATTSVDSTGAYHFYNVPAGAYYIKAKPGPMSQYFGQFLPTYYPHNVFWGNATAVIIPPVNNPYNINLKPAQAPGPGPGMIGGLITQGFKLSGSGAPVSNVEILLKPVSGDPFIFAESNANGEFNFNDLGYGTYEVFPEVTGLTTIPATITLSANNPVVNNVNMVITPNQVATGINDDMESMNMFTVYPNPASTTIHLELSTEMPVDAVLSIMDLTGRALYSGNVSLSTGKQTFDFDLSTFESGTYLLQLKTVQGSVSYRKFAVIQ